MTVTSQLIGTIGGKVTSTSKNFTISKGAGFVAVHEVTVTQPSMVSVAVEHDNTNAFGLVLGQAAVALWPSGQTRTADNTFYSANYGIDYAYGDPLSIAVVLAPGTYSIGAILNSNPAGSGQTSTASYRVTGVKTAITPT